MLSPIRIRGVIALAIFLTTHAATAQQAPTKTPDPPPPSAPGETAGPLGDSVAPTGQGAPPTERPPEAPLTTPDAAATPEPPPPAPESTAPAAGAASQLMAPEPAPNIVIRSPAPGATSARRMLESELYDVEGELRDLQRQRPGLGGPIALTVVGVATTSVFALMGLVALASAEAEAIDCDDSFGGYGDYGYSHRYDSESACDDERRDRNVARTMGVLSVAGASMIAGGTVFLFRRLAERRRLSPDIKRLRLRHKQLRRELRYGLSARPDGAVLSLGGRFSAL